MSSDTTEALTLLCGSGSGPFTGHSPSLLRECGCHGHSGPGYFLGLVFSTLIMWVVEAKSSSPLDCVLCVYKDIPSGVHLPRTGWISLLSWHLYDFKSNHLY